MRTRTPGILWGTERSGVSITSLRALVGGRVVFNTRANFVSFAILGQRRLCACSFERRLRLPWLSSLASQTEQQEGLQLSPSSSRQQPPLVEYIAPAAAVSRGAGSSTDHGLGVDLGPSSTVAVPLSLRQIGGDCEVSYAAPAQVVEYFTLAPALFEAPASAFHALRSGRMEITVQDPSASSGWLIQRLTSEHRRCWLHHRLRPWELFQDLAEYVQDQARPPTTVMTSLRRGVSPTVDAQKPQVTYRSGGLPGRLLRSHEDCDHHGPAMPATTGVASPVHVVVYIAPASTVSHAAHAQVDPVSKGEAFESHMRVPGRALRDG